jgi:hypothetical protein
MYNHQDTWLPTEAQQLEKLYAKQLAQWNALLFAHKEGVFEITIRSQSITETIVLDGDQIAWELAEAVSDKLSATEAKIRRHTLDKHEHFQDDEKQEARAEKRRQEAVDLEHEVYRLNTLLAQQAASTAEPVQRQAGRPRKQATPKPEVMEQVAAQAAQVPMNGNTANAAARATGSTPQG